MNQTEAVAVLREALRDLLCNAAFNFEAPNDPRPWRTKGYEALAATTNIADGREGDNEAAAEAVYNCLEGSKAHPWQVGGNSHKQDEARMYARAALAAADRAAIQPAGDELLRSHASIIVTNICAHSKAGHTMTGWLDDACTSAEILQSRLAAPISEGSASAGVVAKTTPYLGVGRRATEVKISVGQQWKTRSGRTATIKEIHSPLPYPHAKAMVTFDIFDAKIKEVSHDHRCGLDGREGIDHHHSNDLVEYIARHTPEHIERVLGKGEAGEIATWQERVNKSGQREGPHMAFKFAEEEIADLRAALARTAPASATSAPSDAWTRADEAYWGTGLTIGGKHRPFAPTAPAPRASIGDDVEFVRLLSAWDNSAGLSETQEAFLNMAAYIETLIKGGGKP